jgi:GAF domain-containing protein
MPHLSDLARRRIATSLAVVSVVLVVADTLVVAASMPLFSTRSVGIHGWPLVDIASAGSAVLGAIIVVASPRHPVGWLLNVVGASTSLSLLAESYAVWVLDYDGPGPTRAADLSGWLSAFTGGALALAGLAVTFLLVPTGRLLSRRWRWVVVMAGTGYVSFCAGIIAIGPHQTANQTEDTADGDPVAQVFLSVGILLVFASVLASVACMLVRLRRSHGMERQQIRVVAMGASAVGLSLIMLLVGESLKGGEQTWWSSMPLFIAYVLMVGCITVAVLRYRLYDVEVIISRALVVAMAAGFAVLGYVGLVVVLGQSAGDRADGGFWISLLVTAAVALAFQPLRRGVVRFADRLAYGTRAAPYDALADFSRRIGHSPAPGTVLPAIAAAAGEAVHADRVVVRLWAKTGPDLVEVWPPGSEVSQDKDAPAPDVLVPVIDPTGHLGSIALQLPPGRDVRPHERRLLSDIAEQAAVAFSNAQLQVQLAAQVEQLDRRTRDLAASRNRVIGAADTERRRLEAAIGRSVLPVMSDLRTKLVACADAPLDDATMAGFVQQATDALEALRELTRGIYPTLLTRSGLGPALTSYASRMQRPDALRIDPAVASARFTERVEAAVYFCAVEALGPPDTEGPTVDVQLDGDTLVLSSHGLALDSIDRLAVIDRVEACGGSLKLVQLHDQTTLHVRLPAVAAGFSEPVRPPATPAGAARD